MRGAIDSTFPDASILVVDDTVINVVLLERYLAAWGYRDVVSTTESAEVLGLVERHPPDLVLLDLFMPEPDGFTLLERLRERERGAVRLPIIVLTGDTNMETRRRALALGATDFLTKPFDATEVALRVRGVLETRMLQLELQRDNVALEQRVRARTQELEQARMEMLEHLATASEFRDDSTHEHARRVGRTAAAICRQLGVAAREVDLIDHAAPLHDVGKIGIPDTLLLKPGGLTDDERQVMQTHTTLGAEILAGSSSAVLTVAREIASSHHERWDGKGYPAGLDGQDIPLTGRVTAVADVFDALTHRRPYKEPWPVEAAVEEIRRSAGSHFDPVVVDAFDALDHERLALTPVSVNGTARNGHP